MDLDLFNAGHGHCGLEKTLARKSFMGCVYLPDSARFPAYIFDVAWGCHGSGTPRSFGWRAVLSGILAFEYLIDRYFLKAEANDVDKTSRGPEHQVAREINPRSYLADRVPCLCPGRSLRNSRKIPRGW